MKPQFALLKNGAVLIPTSSGSWQAGVQSAIMHRAPGPFAVFAVKRWGTPQTLPLWVPPP